MMKHISEHMKDSALLKNLERQKNNLEAKRAKEKGKELGECDACGMHTVLVAEVGLCGPCCFGEADTIMGNW